MSNNLFNREVEEAYKDNKRIIDIVNLLKDKWQTPDMTDERFYEKVRCRVRRFRKIDEEKELLELETEKNSGFPQEFSVNEKGEVSSDKLIKIHSEEEITPSRLLELHGLNKYEWEIMSYTNNMWNSYSKQDGQFVMLQSKIRAKPLGIGKINIEEIQEHFDKFKPKEFVIKDFSKRKSNKMLEINVADLHLGKLAWHGDSGENYDYKIAKERFENLIKREIERVKEIEPEKVLFVWSNDFFNSDTITKTTTSGTPQDTDLRWQKLFLVGIEMLVQAIYSISQYAPIETFYVASNHSEQTDFYALCYIHAYFKNNKSVNVIMNTNSRLYYRYGNCMIGFMHGNSEVKKIVPSLMSIEAPEMWGATKYREIHRGHLHSEQVSEENGVIVRNLPSLTSSDAWHYKKGYVGATKRSYSFLWDKETGLDAIYSSTLEEIMNRID